jgi:hypothetical protein
MLSRRVIFWISVSITLVAHLLMLWLAPQIILLQSDRLAERITTRFQVEFVDAPPETVRAARAASSEATVQREIETLFSSDPGTLEVENSMLAEPVETPQLAERLAAESIERTYDLEQDQERSKIMDTRILEIAAEDARREINIPRQLVRPSPTYTLPMDAIPALRSRDIQPENIALEPARIGAGLLAQALPMPDDAPQGDGTEPPPFEEGVIGGEPDGTATAAAALERTIVEKPLEKEAEKAKAESAYAFMDDLVDIQLETYVANPQEPGYFRLRILPRKDAAIEPLPRDFIFVVDASRSMQQRKLDLVTRGIADALGRFQPEDRFNILLFRDTVTPFQQEPVYAIPENITAAQSFLNGLESRGQTDVYNALLPLAQMTPRPNLPGIVLLASDGVPTTGVLDSRTIINAITQDNALRNSVFAYGAGNTADRYLLDLLAYRNKGEAHVSGDMQQARGDIAAFINRLANPILVQLNVAYGQSVRGEVYPRIIPDFYAERPITLYGRFEPGADNTFTARITGQAGDASKELVFRADMETANKGGKEIAQGWAFEKSYDLIGEISRQGEQPELLEALRQLSQQYSIRTIYDRE